MFVTGRAVVLTAVGAVAVMLVPSPTTAWLWLALVAAGGAMDVILAASPRAAAVTRDTTTSVRLGEMARSTLTLHNPGRRPMRAVVRDAWVPSAGATANRHRITIPRSERRRVRTALVPTRRGRRAADLVTVRCAGPLGLAGRQGSLEVPGSVLVLPPFHSRRHLPSRLARLREMDGRTAVLVRGQGTEFDSLREYVIGDDVRSIDWRATARAGDVVVRTWRPERDRRVLVVVDTGRLSAVRLGDETRLDAQVEAALLLAALASHAGDRVDVVAVDTEVRSRVAGQSGPRLMNELAVGLADVEPALAETNWTRVAAVVRETLSQHALVVLLTALEPANLGNGLLAAAQALARDHTVMVASATDPAVARLVEDRSDTDALYRAAAAERAGLEREAAETRLRHRGVEVVESPAEELPPDLADAYLRLKRAGRL
ncbi:MAG: DUF58 domain-containing protein [Actinomycetota bacterium]